ncbi:hypothetical protein KEM48_006078 [Puccinia striiformis f. sp. tritici PST-130]|nr:hypothetical protein KEM48_006078 [Puccinia striiformis f. sp. tritici PST-130]
MAQIKSILTGYIGSGMVRTERIKAESERRSSDVSGSRLPPIGQIHSDVSHSTNHQESPTLTAILPSTTNLSDHITIKLGKKTSLQEKCLTLLLNRSRKLSKRMWLLFTVSSSPKSRSQETTVESEFKDYECKKNETPVVNEADDNDSVKTLKELGQSPIVIELDEVSDGEAQHEYIKKKTGQRTVPAVFIKTKFIGGNSEIQALHAKKELEPLF